MRFKDGTYGGICLDNYKRIPNEYRDIIKIGKNVRIFTGVVLGSDGFGYNEMTDGTHKHREHRYGIEIGDNVDIFPLCTIHRGRWRRTSIGGGTKIDSFSHIAHNVAIGNNCIIGAHATILGSATIGNGTKIWANATIHQWVKIGNNCIIGANSYIRHDVPDNMMVYGTGDNQVIKPVMDKT